MAVRIAVFVVGIALLLAAPLTQEHEVLQFSYNGATGPAKWGSLSPQNSACSAGKLQSPVNIVKKEIVGNPKLLPLTRDYHRTTNSTLINHGFNIEMQFESNGGFLIEGGKKYTLKRMHWHSPSEHTFDGVRHALELHLVHIADDGSISVVAILYNYGHPDLLLLQFKNKIEQLAKKTHGRDEEVPIPTNGVRTKYLRSKTVRYYRYVGSLTTPPCTQNVTWSILGKVRQVTKEQIEALRAPLDGSCKSNARPVQPMNGRMIELYDAKRGN